MTRPVEKVVGVVGLYEDPRVLLRAAEQVREAGFTRWDCHTPFPVHGLDRAMGLKASPMPRLAITGAFVGLAVAIVMTGGLNVIQYPIRIAGKPLWSWQAFVPIYFELFVLFAGVTIMVSLLVLCKLGRWQSPLHDSDVMKDVTCDKFAIVLEASDNVFDEARAKALLASTGCIDVRPLIEFEEEDGAIL